MTQNSTAPSDALRATQDRFEAAAATHAQAGFELLQAVAAEVRRRSGHTALQVGLSFDVVQITCVGGGSPAPLHEVAATLQEVAEQAAWAAMAVRETSFVVPAP